ncbi:hypothetical protein BC941DRAFT_420058 [Chlamydoabsidia padenii]|nr:hypothetical protein BC941DRAFT_420058 [Chlamydoabsidia padenii]
MFNTSNMSNNLADVSLHTMPDFDGTEPRYNWFCDNIGPRQPQDVSAILSESVEEYLLYVGLSREQKKEMYEQLAPSLQRNYDRIVYTDGSCRLGAAGYGAWWGDAQGHSINGPIPYEQSSLRAEFYGVYQSFLNDTNVCDAMRMETDCFDVIKILHDTCCNKRNVSNDPNRDICNMILSVMARRIGPIGLGYVPGHCRIDGNVNADRIAGYASLNALLARRPQNPQV